LGHITAIWLMFGFYSFVSQAYNSPA